MAIETIYQELSSGIFWTVEIVDHVLFVQKANSC